MLGVTLATGPMLKADELADITKGKASLAMECERLSLEGDIAALRELAEDYSLEEWEPLWEVEVDWDTYELSVAIEARNDDFMDEEWEPLDITTGAVIVSAAMLNPGPKDLDNLELQLGDDGVVVFTGESKNDTINVDWKKNEWEHELMSAAVKTCLSLLRAHRKSDIKKVKDFGSSETTSRD